MSNLVLCPHCDHQINTQPDYKMNFLKPVIGALCLCMACCEYSQYDHNLQLEKFAIHFHPNQKFSDYLEQKQIELRAFYNANPKEHEKILNQKRSVENA